MIGVPLIDTWIPGYTALPHEVRTAFEATDEGDELLQTIQQLEKNLTRPREAKTSGIYRLYQGLFQLRTATEIATTPDLTSIHAYLHVTMHSSDDYLRMIDDLTRKLNLKLHTWSTQHIERLYTDMLQTLSKQHITIMDLDAFNAKHAKTLVTQYDTIEPWMEEYTRDLQTQIQQNLSLINGHEPFSTEASPNLPHEHNNALSRLYAFLCSNKHNKKTIKWCADAINRAADAHAFLQATGFATQNETSWLAGFDVVNYFRMAGGIAEIKSIFLTFIQPFTPLFMEYSRINREHNITLQVLRTVIPMLIVSSAVILVSALLSSVVIPEIAFLFILIPTVYLGLIAASGYIVARDALLNTLAQWWAGGPFNISEYQINPGMIASFGSEEKAQNVRDFYVAEITTCLKNEDDYKAQIKLSEADKDSRKLNKNRHQLLLLEWYDIHSNPKLSTDECVSIALNRLQDDGKAVSDALRLALEQDRAEALPAFAHDMAFVVKQSIDRTRIPSPLTDTATLQTASCRFFTPPHCFTLKKELERLHLLTLGIKQA